MPVWVLVESLIIGIQPLQRATTLMLSHERRQHQGRTRRRLGFQMFLKSLNITTHLPILLMKSPQSSASEAQNPCPIITSHCLLLKDIAVYSSTEPCNTSLFRIQWDRRTFFKSSSCIGYRGHEASKDGGPAFAKDQGLFKLSEENGTTLHFEAPCASFVWTDSIHKPDGGNKGERTAAHKYCVIAVWHQRIISTNPRGLANALQRIFLWKKHNSEQVNKIKTICVLRYSFKRCSLVPVLITGD